MPLPKSLPTPSNPSASGITFFGSANINTPASLVWAKLLDFQNYSWNTFTPVAIFECSRIEPGVHGTLDAYVGVDDTNRPTKVQLTLVDEENRKLAWKGLGILAWALRPERVQEIVDLGGGKCEYRTWETMAGPGATVVSWMMGGKLDEANERCGRDLKRVMEAGTG